MKKLIFLGSLFAALIIGSYNDVLADSCSTIDESSIKRHVEDMPLFTIASKKAIDSLCEVVIKIEGNYVPVYVTPEYLIMGEMFAYKSHVSKETISALQQQDFIENKAKLDELVAFTYKPQDATSYIYFITDPDCPYCERAKAPLKEFAKENKVELKVILLPLPIHPGAKKKAIRAVCGKINYEDYLQNKYPEKTCPKGEEVVNKVIQLASKLSIMGTPTFITPNGENIMGFNPSELKRVISN